MTDALFLVEEAALADAVVGGEIVVGGDEGRHAVVVRRIRPGERVLVADGRGSAVRGAVLSAEKSSGLRVRVDERLTEPQPDVRVSVVQALAKGDRAELAVETMTELGVAEIIPWQASRSIVRWSDGERGAKQLARWQAAAREATKQSRRFRVPPLSDPLTTKQICERIAASPAAYVLHEDATDWLADQRPAADVLAVVGPRGGISPDELDAFGAGGALPVLVSDAVLRTSTAGVVALAQLQALVRRGGAA